MIRSRGPHRRVHLALAVTAGMISHGRSCPASFTRLRLGRTASLGISAVRPALHGPLAPAQANTGRGPPQPGKTFCCGGACLASIGVGPGPKQINPARQIKTDRMLSHVRACARAPLSRARIPRFPAAARRPGAGARGSFGFSLVGVSFAVLDATGSTAELSYVLAAQIAPSLIFLLLGGVVADRMPPQRVIVAANIMIAVGEGTFGVLVLAGHPALWQMIALEVPDRHRMALFYPASSGTAAPGGAGEQLQEASALSRMAMNGGADGRRGSRWLLVAAFGPGWALAVCGPACSARCRAAGARAVRPRASAPPGMSVTCVRAGRSSARTPGCG